MKYRLRSYIDQARIKISPPLSPSSSNLPPYPSHKPIPPKHNKKHHPNPPSPPPPSCTIRPVGSKTGQGEGGRGLSPLRFTLGGR